MKARLPVTVIHLLVAALLVAVMALGAAGRASAASIVYVKYNAVGSNNGSSWANACKSLQKALTAAVSGQQIWVARGTYLPTLPTNNLDPRTKTFQLKNGVAIYGGFAGTETLLSQRNWKTNVTVLSGDIGTAGNPGDNSYHVVTGNATKSTAVLDGFTISGGNANGSSDNGFGGGVYINNFGSPTLRDLIFKANSAADGGGMYNANSFPKLYRVVFVGNSATDLGGGGMYNYFSSPVLNVVSFGGNTANSASSGGAGGGMYNYASNPSLTNVTFRGNAGVYGGAMFNVVSSDPVLTNAAIVNNSSQRGGGGIYDASSSPALANVSFTGNTAPGWTGGGMYNGHSDPVLTNVNFAGNSASYGGGLYNESSSPTLTKVTFKSNSATSNGGGIFNSSSSPAFNNAAFAGNSASMLGGGMYNYSSGPTLVHVSFTGNSAASGGGMYDDHFSTPTLFYVMFSGNSATADAGALYESKSGNKLTNVAFIDNKAGNNAGAVYNDSSGPLYMDALFSGNSAPNGGAMLNYSGSPSLTNATFTGNTASIYGGAIFDYAGSSPSIMNATFSGNTATSDSNAMLNLASSNARISNSIFWGDGSAEMFNPSSAPSISESIVQGGCPTGAGCSNLINGDPKLGLLQYHGGFSQTMALGSGSAAIDAVDAATCPSEDGRGVARPQGSACDLGAYEVNVLSLPLQAAYDGWVLESGQSTNIGGSLNATGATLFVGDNKLNRRFRGFLSFNTAALPDTAVVIQGTLEARESGAGGDPFGTQGSLLIDLAKPYFGTGPGLALSDWQASATVAAAGSFGSTMMPANSWYMAVLSSAALSNINKTGTTQFRLRFASEHYNSLADYLAFYSSSSAAANQPLLVVYYNP